MPGVKTWEQHLSRRRLALRAFRVELFKEVVDSVEDLLEGVPMKTLQVHWRNAFREFARRNGCRARPRRRLRLSAPEPRHLKRL